MVLDSFDWARLLGGYWAVYLRKLLALVTYVHRTQKCSVITPFVFVKNVAVAVVIQDGLWVLGRGAPTLPLCVDLVVLAGFLLQKKQGCRFCSSHWCF